MSPLSDENARNKRRQDGVLIDWNLFCLDKILINYSIEVLSYQRLMQNYNRDDMTGKFLWEGESDGSWKRSPGGGGRWIEEARYRDKQRRRAATPPQQSPGRPLVLPLLLLSIHCLPCTLIIIFLVSAKHYFAIYSCVFQLSTPAHSTPNQFKTRKDCALHIL